jgi:hypothetical protein
MSIVWLAQASIVSGPVADEQLDIDVRIGFWKAAIRRGVKYFAVETPPASACRACRP